MKETVNINSELSVSSDHIPFLAGEFKVNFPVRLLGYLMILIIQLVFVFIHPNNGLLCLQLGLILMSLLYDTIQRHENGGQPVRITWKKMLLFVLLTATMMFQLYVILPNGSGTTVFPRLELVCFILVAILVGARILDIVPKLKHFEISRKDYLVRLMAVTTVILTVLFIFSLNAIMALWNDSESYAFGTKMVLILGNFITGFAIFRILIHYLQRPASDPSPAMPGKVDSPVLIGNSAQSSEWYHREMLTVVLKIDHEFEHNKFFLNKTISLELLSERTNVSKHKLTETLKSFYQKGFYHLVAEFRIRYAMKILDHDRTHSLEALSDLCGFNSKSSFYKYFKKFNGCTPNEYLQLRNEQGLETNA